MPRKKKVIDTIEFIILEQELIWNNLYLFQINFIYLLAVKLFFFFFSVIIIYD